MKACIIVVVVSIVATAAMTFYFIEKDFSQALRIFRQAEVARSSERAVLAYFTQPPAIAKWEQEEFSEFLKTIDLSQIAEPDTIKFYRFIATARLAKLNKESGDAKSYGEYLLNALEAGKQFNNSLTNADSLFKFLERTDEISLKSRNATE